jgi:hypothetical protein
LVVVEVVIVVVPAIPDAFLGILASFPVVLDGFVLAFLSSCWPFVVVSGTIIRGTLKTPNSQLVTPISIKLQRPDGCD